MPLNEEDLTRTIQVGSSLSDELREKLINFLRKNMDVFVWSILDMSGIPLDVIVHWLNVDAKHKPVRQKKRNFAPEWQKAIDEEVDRLLAANFICETIYLNWLVNIVMVKKANSK